MQLFLCPVMLTSSEKKRVQNMRKFIKSTERLQKWSQLNDAETLHILLPHFFLCANIFFSKHQIRSLIVFKAPVDTSRGQLFTVTHWVHSRPWSSNLASYQQGYRQKLLGRVISWYYKYYFIIHFLSHKAVWSFKHGFFHWENNFLIYFPESNPFLYDCTW